jgi:osmotically-inducible protein OsmY
MNIHKPILYTFALGLIVASGLSGCATYGKCGIGGCAGDAKITANVQAQFDRHPELGAPNSIQVQTLDHVVYLNGLVSTGMDSQTAESVAMEVPDVSRVVNSVAVSH